MDLFWRVHDNEDYRIFGSWLGFLYVCQPTKSERKCQGRKDRILNFGVPEKLESSLVRPDLSSAAVG